MPDDAGLIKQQYGQDDLSAKILAALQNAGKNVDALTRDDLKTFDEFHIGGVAETRTLAELAKLRPGMSVLDVGSGLGGPARTLAVEYGCRVTGLDITDEYCRAAEMLSARLGLSEQTRFHCGSALNMPFEDGSFDAVWTQFVGMNISDKQTFYREVRRVLKNGGIFALHEVMAGAHPDLHYPVFWANDAARNCLRPQEEIQQLLAAEGFKSLIWQDVTQHSYDWFRAMVERAQQRGPMPLGFHVFIPDSVTQKATNIIKNLEEHLITVVQAVFEVQE